MNKRKRVAWEKHRIRARKMKLRQRLAGGQGAVTVAPRAIAERPAAATPPAPAGPAPRPRRRAPPRPAQQQSTQ